MEFGAAIEEATAFMNFLPLKPKQAEALQTFTSGHDVFVALPTGYGKSVIYAILPRLFDNLLGVNGSIVVVITPLISLMMDQKEKFKGRGISIEFVGEAQEDESAVAAVISGNIQLVFISPESLLGNPCFRNMLLSESYKARLRAVAVDEAHCVKLWGDKFRAMFSEIGNIRCLIPSSVNLLALTATVTRESFDSICKSLLLDNLVLIGLPPNRANIKYIVKECPSINELCHQLTNELMSKRQNVPKTVLFCRSLQSCADVFVVMKRMLGKYVTEPPGMVTDLQVRLVDVFTAVSTFEMRELILKEFSKSDTKLRLLIATTAFGLGVDCPDIARIINFGSPATLEELVQESGRAGRNRISAEAILYPKKVGKMELSVVPGQY